MTNKEAINYISKEGKSVFRYDSYMLQALDMAIKALEERPQGEWIFQYTFLDNCLYKCSHCNRLLSLDVQQEVKQFLFCPNCGADMRKGGAKSD